MGLHYHNDGSRNESTQGLKPDQKMKVRIDGDVLTVSDEDGGEEQYRRQPVKSGAVAITALPLYGESCATTLRQVFTEVTGASEITIDRKTRSARLTLADLGDWDEISDAIYRAGMEAKVDESSTARSPMRTVGFLRKPKQIRFGAVHACCPECRQAIVDRFPSEKVTFEGDGPTRDVVISGEELDDRAIGETLRKAGFRAYMKAD